MTLKELAHAAHHALQAQSGCDVSRSHIYELLAAALGHRSWAAFDAASLLTDAGVSTIPKARCRASLAVPDNWTMRSLPQMSWPAPLSNWPSNGSLGSSAGVIWKRS